MTTTPKPKPIPLVVHIIYELGTGGLENGLINLINRIPPKRFRHAIICLTTAGDFARRIQRDDVQILEMHKAPGHDFSLYFRVFNALRKLHPDIVHTRNLAALEMQALTVLLPRIKTVHGEHGRDVNDLDGSNRKYRMLRRLLCPLINQFITVSQDLKEWLVDEVGVSRKKVTQIYNGVDQERFQKAAGAFSQSELPEGFLTEGQIVIGTVGRLAEVKNQRMLIDAVTRMIESIPETAYSVRVLIVGDGPLADTLKEAAYATTHPDIFHFAGDREDIPALLNCMDIFALPSLGEGISNTILEAMASGLPVVATNVGGNPELVTAGDNGTLVPVGDVTALAAALYKLVDDSQERQRMGNNAQQRIAEQFSWDRAVSDYIAVYDQLLGRVQGVSG